MYGSLALAPFLLMAVDAAVSLRIASNSIKVEVYKLVVSNFKYR